MIVLDVNLEGETSGIDILVNNAGLVDGRGRVEDFDDDIWDRDVVVNLTSTCIRGRYRN